MTTIQENLEVDRKVLLDLSMRNTLLNFRPLRSKGLIVEDELSDQVFRILVTAGSRMTLLAAPEAATGSTENLSLRVGGQNHNITKDGNVLRLCGQPDEETKNRDNKPAARHIDRKLQTPHSDGRLQRRLLNSYYVARSSIEEHGVNTLFLALGFLRWFESDSSEEQRKAPLILVPVKLDRPSAQAKFRLEYTDDDLGTNLSLQEKLHRDFGVSLPEFEAADEDGVTDYFAAVMSAVSKLGRWEVHPNEIHLGFFSFTKLLMYKDLDSDSWPEDRKPADHPVLRALLGVGFKDSTPSHLPSKELDERLPPDDSTHIWDADSSQTLALLEAAGGRNLVIQGPPGTGKSQTITNLIADAVASGKRVLFVAEKMAALEVVKRRLDNANVGDLCLELHSHKSNKSALLEDLRKTLRLGRPELPDFDAELKELGGSIESLNRYCAAVHRTIADSSTTPYQAFGALLRLRRELGEDELPVIDNQTLRHWPRHVFRGRLERLRAFKSALETIGVPSRHVFWGSKAAIFLPKHATEVAGRARAALEALIRYEEAAGSLAREMGLDHPSNLHEADRTLDAARRAAGAPPLAGVAAQDPSWLTQKEDIESSVSQGSNLQEIRRSRKDLLLPESWEEEVLETRREYGRYADKWWRLLSGRYRAARRNFLGLFQEKPPKSNQERVELLDTILEAQRLTKSLSEKQDVIRSLLGTHWRGFASDFSQLRNVTGFLVDLHEAVAESKTPAGLLDYLSVERDSAALRKRIDEVEHCRVELDTALDQAWERTQFSAELRFGRPTSQVAFPDLASLFSAWVKEPETLREMTQFNTWANEFEKESLSELVVKCASWVDASRHADRLFEKAWYDGLLEEALKERPELQVFDSKVHGKTLLRFRKLDRWLLKRNRLRLAQKHWETLPNKGAGGQITVLKREFEKKRRHKKIRQLLTEAGRAIQGIKPVFMMSPLSVAAYLPREGVDFDLVVFDEASQVTPVDAYGALLRGQQAVVVGDSKQLPPTPFFNTISEDEEREEHQASDLESVLGLFSSCNAPNAMLRWHYRSQHESLITVSNHEFYNNELFVFPSPDQTRQDLGLVYRKVNGTFLRGRGRSCNPHEAKVVADAVLRHAREQPHLTLGVAAFSQKQSQ